MAEVISCKLKCTEVATTVEMGKKVREDIKLEAVYGPEGSENATWSKYTPTANFNLSITNEAAFEKLVKGKEYYIYINPAE